MPRAKNKMDKIKDKARNSLKEIVEYMEKYNFMCTICSEPFDEVEVKNIQGTIAFSHSISQ